KNVQLASARSDVRDELNSASASADHSNSFAGQIHVRTPCGGMERWASKALDTRNLRIVRDVESAHAGDNHPGTNGQRIPWIAVAGRDVIHCYAPLPRRFIPSAFTEARLEANVRLQAVALHTGLQVLPDLLLTREHARPIRIALERKRIQMRWHVASA